MMAVALVLLMRLALYDCVDKQTERHDECVDTQRPFHFIAGPHRH